MWRRSLVVCLVLLPAIFCQRSTRRPNGDGDGDGDRGGTDSNISCKEYDCQVDSDCGVGRCVKGLDGSSSQCCVAEGGAMGPDGGGPMITEADLTEQCPLMPLDSTAGCPAGCNTADNCDASKQQVCCETKACGNACTPDMSRCTNVMEWIKSVMAQVDCQMLLVDAISRNKLDEYCSLFINGSLCIAKSMVGLPHLRECMARMRVFIEISPTAVFEQLGSYGISYNEDVVSESAKCFDMMGGGGGDRGPCAMNPCNQGRCIPGTGDAYKCDCTGTSYGGEHCHEYTGDDSEWNTPCPEMEIEGENTQMCPRECSADRTCSNTKDVCCPVNGDSCHMCLPDMRQCANSSEIVRTLITDTCKDEMDDLFESDNFEDFCESFWESMECVSEQIASTAYHKMCLKRMVKLIRRGPSTLLKMIEQRAGKRMPRDIQTYARKVLNCKESPDREASKRPVPDAVKECSDVQTIMTSGRNCRIEITDGATTNRACMKLKEFVNCVVTSIHPDVETNDIKRKQCANEIIEVIREHTKDLKMIFPALAEMDVDDCREKQNICGGDMEPLDDITCPRTRCPNNYSCKEGFCCPMRKEGVCPRPRGTPLCKAKCKNDYDCDGDEKCCDIGCGPKTCVAMESSELSPCQLEMKNARRQLERTGICGDGTTLLKVPKCVNKKYHPIQGDFQNGLLHCVYENGTKIPGSDFTGNRDCTTVRPGVCPPLPAICQTSNVVVNICENDHDCGEGEKCCAGQESDVCAMKCVKANRAIEEVTDDCPNRQCCQLTLCQNRECAKDRTAVCRINSCGGCKVEFYNADGIVDCEDGISSCQKERTRAKQNNDDRATQTVLERLRKFFEERERNGNGQMEQRRQEGEMGRMMTGGDGDDDDDDDGYFGDDDNDDDDDYEDDDEITDEYGEERATENELPDDDEEPETETDHMGMMHTLERICTMMDRYNICRNDGYCNLGSGETMWEVCACPEGTYGLLCDKSLTETGCAEGFYGSMCERVGSPPASKCDRDRERVYDLKMIMADSTKVKEQMIFGELFNKVRMVKYLPEISCDHSTGRFEPIMKGYTIPLNKDSMEFYFCADPDSGDRLMFTPVTLSEKEIPNCYEPNYNYPDILDVSRKCVKPNPSKCDQEPCGYYWNQNDKTCEAGTVGDGFGSLTECFDKCAVKAHCDYAQPETCSLVFFDGPEPCMGLMCDYHTEFCNVTTDGEGMLVGECKAFPDHCLLSPDSGRVPEDRERSRGIGAYYFNATTRRCEKFTYYGEGGNKNRFYNAHECHTTCSTREKKYNDVVCPTSDVLQRLGHSQQCGEDNDCDGDQVCCSNTDMSVCTPPFRSCSSGERCSLYGACEDGECICPECNDADISPVCGSNGMTYNSSCHLKQYACETHQPITELTNCQSLACGSTTCKHYELCSSGQCTCPQFCTEIWQPVCGQGVRSGVKRTFSNDCFMNMASCMNDKEEFIKAADGPCAPEGSDQCLLACTKEYRPVCAYNKNDGNPTLTTYNNKCLMMKEMLCNDSELEVLYQGECSNTKCGCEMYEICVNDTVCTCPSMCTMQYDPVCAYPLGNEKSLETFSNPCMLRKHSCEEQKVYAILKKGACQQPEPEYTCPKTPKNIVGSAQFLCNVDTNSFCDKDEETCCPYGAGTRCIPNKRMVRKTMKKEGICPRMSRFNMDRSMCRKCRDDSDCGDRNTAAKCCPSTLCGFDTCVVPYMPDETKVCGAGQKLIEDLSCDHTSATPGCPEGAKCNKVVNEDGSIDGVCCISTKQDMPKESEIIGSHFCRLLDLIGIQCENGGKCSANLTSGQICKCTDSYYGPFCQYEKCNMVQCFADPCSVSTCKNYPSAVCQSNYCGGCNAVYTYNDEDVTSKCGACTQWQCTINPCDVNTCDMFPNAVCIPDWCGGCNAKYTYEFKDVTQMCKAETLCQRQKFLYSKIDDVLGISDMIQMRECDLCEDEDDKDEEMESDTVMQNLMMVLAKTSNFRGLPKDMEIQCSTSGDFEPIQCIVNKDTHSDVCFCVNTTTGMPFRNTARASNPEGLDCSLYSNNDGVRPRFCTEEVPDTTSVCEGTSSERFYFNPATGDCEGFTDTGCNANGTRNLFNSLDTCNAYCVMQRTTLSMCATVRCGFNTRCVIVNGSAKCVGREDSGEYEPMCEDDGKYSAKQCNGDVCKCVDPASGTDVADSVAMGTDLECIVVDGTTRARKRQNQKCEDGSEPVFCENGGDNCKNCEKRQGDGDGSGGQGGSGRPNGQGGQGGQGGNDGRPAADGTCPTCNSCPADSKKKACKATCTDATCESFPSAICEINACTCEKVFKAGDEVVDCAKVNSKCKRAKNVQENEQRANRLRNQGQNDDVPTIECTDDGLYERQCMGNKCQCLNATSGEPTGQVMDSDKLNCENVQRKTKALSMKLRMKLSDRSLKTLSQEKQQKLIEKVKEHFEKFNLDVTVTLREGSIFAEVDAKCTENCNADLSSTTEAASAQINTGEVTFVVNDEVFVPSNAQVTEVTTPEQLYGPVTEPTPSDDDDNKTTIIIVVVVIVVVAIVAIAVAVYCYTKANKKQKTENMQFDDIRGQDNPTYKS